MNIREIANLCKGYEHVYITGHVHPDGDCLGSTIALSRILRKYDIQAPVLLRDLPSNLSYVYKEGEVLFDVPENIEVLIALDCGDQTRLGHMTDAFTVVPLTLNIDHHISNVGYGTHSWIVTGASSTCEMVYDLLEGVADVILDKDIATAIYTGILTDTGCFKHSNTTRHTHEVAGHLLEYGIESSWMIDNLFYSKNILDVKATGRAFEHLHMLFGERIALAYLTQADSLELQITKEHTEGVVQKLNEIREAIGSVFIYETEHEVFKVSLRAKTTLDMCLVAQAFGGGGHIKASGCTIEGTLDAVIHQITVELAAQLDER